MDEIKHRQINPIGYLLKTEHEILTKKINTPLNISRILDEQGTIGL